MNTFKKIAVNEIFGPTVQGEGSSIGKEVIFLRTSGCNLACIWCDTPYTWNWKGTKFLHPDKYNPRDEVHSTEIEEVVQKLREIGETTKALVISGGEPLLQQSALIELMKILKAEGWWIEIETNGTIMVTSEFLELVDQINCSPKLVSSGIDNPFLKRINLSALNRLAESKKTWFKFVVCNEDDLIEIRALVKMINSTQVYLMPEGRTKAEQLANSEAVEALAKENGFNFSPRLHILKYDAARGV